jgi:hypothetical protein
MHQNVFEEKMATSGMYKLRTADVEALQKEEQQIQQKVSRLENLMPTGNTKLRKALETFLLLQAESQIPQLGDSKTFLNQGNAKKAAGDKLLARVNYEIAAKIELYKGNKAGVIESLTLAREVTDENDEHREFHDAILNNLDEALRIAREYYQVSETTSKPDLQKSKHE